VAERQNLLKLIMIFHSLCRNFLRTVQEKYEFSFSSFPVHYLATSNDTLTSGDPKIAAGMQIVFGWTLK
jgi:hypothetical protein